MLKAILALIPLLGTTIGAGIGVAKYSSKADNREKNLVAVATGILAAILVSLLQEAIASLEESLTLKALVGGIFLGVLFILITKKIAHQEETHHKLFIAMLIHNIPEGIVIGMALTGTIDLPAIGIVASISLQNIPDGLVVSMSSAQQYGKKRAFVRGFLSGIIEPIASAAIILLAQISTKSISSVEPIFIGFSVATILSLVIDLMRECKKKKIALLAFMATLVSTTLLTICFG